MPEKGNLMVLPGAWMMPKPVLHRRIAKVIDACLGFFRTVLLNLRRALCTRPNDCNMAVLTFRCLEDGHNEIASIGVLLRFDRIIDGTPARFGAFFTKPVVLSVCQEELSVSRRTKEIDAEPFASRRGKHAAVTVCARFGDWLAIRITCPPVHVLTCDPVLLDAQAIQKRRKLFACRADFAGKCVTE